MLKKLVPEFIKAPLRAHFHSMRFSRSQAGQDLWVFGEVFDGKSEGFFLDIGAHDGVEISNSYVLEKRYKWNGICVEANPESFKRLKENRQATCINVCLDEKDGTVSFAKRGMFGGIVSEDTDNRLGVHDSAVIKVRAVTLENLLRELNAPAEIDYLSIDIEGAEERVLKAFPFNRYRFTCMTIERPTEILRRIISDNGYVLIKEIPGLDCFYLHRDFMDQYRANLFSNYSKKYLAICMG